jgi:enoyl-CoA hydratase/carnithine racemase
MHGELVLAIGAALKEAANATGVHCVVVRGAGAMFSSGMDFGALGALSSDPQHLRAFRREVLEAWNTAEEMTKPVICQIHGGCIGGAMELALACDLRVMAADAIVGMPETRVGLIPDVGGSSRLPALVGLGRAKELIMTGKLIGAEEAERIGLVNRVVPAADLDRDAMAFAARLAAGAPLAVRYTKLAVNKLLKDALNVAFDTSTALELVTFQSEDHQEALAALREKRPPTFKGR